MNTKDEIYGREFDWYAIDQNGALAIFSSAGSGEVPEPVLKNYEEHDALTDYMESLDKNGESIWHDIVASHGLFVFDYSLNNGPYIKQLIPTKELPNELKEKIENIKDIPVLNISFEEIREFNV